jgi:TolB-like protein/DNA-binding winged helix-turn-helix (wHTH) protein
MAMAIPSGRVRFGVFEVDLRSSELHKQGIKIKLHPQPFQVLAMLLEHPGELVTREQLRQRLWPADTFVDFEVGLNSAIKRLRDALGDSAESPHFIETLPRRGYRFIGREDYGAPAIAQASALAGPMVSGEPSTAATHETGAAAIEVAARRSRVNLLGILALAGLFAAMLGLNIGGWRQRLLRAPASGRIQSIAVLPLENLTGDPSQEYFSDGMTDALITELAQVRGLSVISRTSAMHYKGTRKALPEIARELHVDAIVEGTVRRNGSEVKITAQLIRAATDTHLWAASYARPQQEVPRLEAEVAEQISRQIWNDFAPVGRTGSSRPSTVDPEAYEAYLKGVYFFNKITPDALRTGLHYYQAAIDKDGKYAAAYSGLANCYMLLSTLGEMSSVEAYTRAREAAEKAVALDENLAEAHKALASIAYGYDWDWNTADQQFQRAIKLNPNLADAHLGYSFLLLVSGRLQESGEELRKAKEVDPLSLPMYTSTIYHLYVTRNYDEALGEARKGVELYPDALLLHDFLSGIYAQTKRPDLAAEEALKAEECAGASPERIAALRRAYQTSGPKGLWRKRIELNKKLAGQHYLNAYDIAYDYAALADTDQVIYWLEKVLRVRDPRLALVGLEPSFDSVRFDPRFQQIQGKLGLHP